MDTTTCGDWRTRHHHQHRIIIDSRSSTEKEAVIGKK